ncbi:MAG: HlyD family efflux transporter periplasmic adaptor subunit [Prochlorococcaceae cyanobacterium]
MALDPQPISRLGFYKRCLNRLRSPGRRPLPSDHVLPVRIDLVGDGSSPVSVPPQTPMLSPTNPFQPQQGEESGTGPAPWSAPMSQPDWSFSETVLLRKSGRATSLIVWTAVGSITALVLWAVFAPLSESIAVQGKLQPGSKVKTIQAPVPGVIEAVLVKEGERVRQGQKLIRFDLRDARSKLTASQTVRERLINENQIIAASLGDGAATGLTSNQRLQLSNQTEELSSRREIARQELKASEARIAGLRNTLAIATNIAERYRNLELSGAVSEVQVLETRNKVDELKTNLAQEERNADKLRAAVISSQVGPGAELRSRIEANLRQISSLDGQIRNANLQLQYSVLTAPSDGAAFDIDVSPGSVVNPTTLLLKVVPPDALEAKVFIPNSAIGFLRVGQSADISLDTYPSTDYGRIPARVQSIGSDALTSEEMAKTLRENNKGLYYPAVLRLQRQSLRASSKSIPLKPGMALSADIRLRERTFISLITSFFDDKLRSLERLR